MSAGVPPEDPLPFPQPSRPAATPGHSWTSRPTATQGRTPHILPVPVKTPPKPSLTLTAPGWPSILATSRLPVGPPPGPQNAPQMSLARVTIPLPPPPSTPPSLPPTTSPPPKAACLPSRGLESQSQTASVCARNRPAAPSTCGRKACAAALGASPPRPPATSPLRGSPWPSA